MALLNLPSEKDLKLKGGERWYLVHTQPHKELLAQRHLGMQGFIAYVPLILKTTRHARQQRIRQAPFFPRYIFVILDLQRDRWLSVRSTLGVSSLLICDGLPVPVPKGIVEGLAGRAIEPALRTGHLLKLGQNVRIVSGSFAARVGTLEGLDERGRVQVLLQMMGGFVRVKTDSFRVVTAS
jgi:transcription elongation factor/antiterminator RfaH